MSRTARSRPTTRRLGVGLAAITLASLTATTGAAAQDTDPPIAAVTSAPAGFVEGRYPVAGLLVDDLYRASLGRTADAAGLAFWTAELEGGRPPASVAAAFIGSEEFEGRVAPVTRLYRAVLDRDPDEAGLRFWLDRLRGGQNLRDVASSFVGSPEFADLAGEPDAGRLVDLLYDRVLDRPADPGGRTFWVDRVESGSTDLGGLVLGFSESAEFIEATSAETRVIAVYLALLGRAPDPGGLAFWAGRVRGGADLAELAAQLYASDEFLARRPGPPTVTADEVADGFVIPWDVIDVGAGRLLVSQRAGGFVLVEADGTTRAVTADLSDRFASGETGVMGLAVDPDDPNRIYSCQGHAGPSIQVIAWSLDVGAPSMTRVADPLIGGLPIVTGRHGGCQLEFGADGQLYVGTGDAAVGSVPQNGASLGGKTLRVDPDTGAASAGNPFIGVASVDDRIYTLGHRNIQGLARHPETGAIWSVEHGPSFDDEVNRLRAGGNAGWNPVPGYNESVTMTDLSFPNAMAAAWSSGRPTLAVSGGTFLDDPAWGSWDGALAIASLKNQTLRFLYFDSAGMFLGDMVVIDATLGRLRAVTVDRDGDVVVTTSTGSDSVWRLSPN